MSLGLKIPEQQRRVNIPPIVSANPPAPAPPLALPKAVRNLHLAAALLHLSIGVVVFAVGNRDLVVQLFLFPTETLNRVEGDWIVNPQSGGVPAGQLHIIGTIAFFEFVTGTFHLLNALAWPHFYAENLARCRAPTRWVEYAITAPVMLVLLAIFSGIIHLYTLLLLFGLTQVTMFFGYLVERYSTPRGGAWVEPAFDRMAIHLMGWVPQLYAWSIITAQFIRYASAVGRDANGAVLNKMPEWVYGLFVGEIFLFMGFAVVQIYVILNPPVKYMVGEISYLVLSFVSKATLSFLIFGGTLNLTVDNRP